MSDLLTQEEAKQQGYIVDTCCNPPVAYKGARFNPTELRYCYTDLEAELRLELAAAKAEIERLKTENEKLRAGVRTIPEYMQMVQELRAENNKLLAEREERERQEPVAFRVDYHTSESIGQQRFFGADDYKRMLNSTSHLKHHPAVVPLFAHPVPDVPEGFVVTGAILGEKFYWYPPFPDGAEIVYSKRAAAPQNGKEK